MNSNSSKMSGFTEADSFESVKKPKMCKSPDNCLDTKQEQVPASKPVLRRVWKNILVVSILFLCVFTGLSPMINIQSSLNAASGIGTLSLSIRELVRMLVGLFLNNFLIDRLGIRRMMFIGMALCSTYIAANFYPTWATMAPAAALYGLGFNCIWGAVIVYISQLSDFYSVTAHISRRTMNTRFFGTFYSVYYCNFMIGNVATSLILGATSPKTANFTYDPLEICGAQFCNEDLGVSFKISYNSSEMSETRRPDDSKIYGLCGFSIAAVLSGAVILHFFLDDLRSFGLNEKRGGDKTNLYILGETLRHLIHPKMILLIPLFVYNGFDDSFLGTELTKAFVTCAIGVEYIGFVSSLFGIFCPISALACGWFNTPKTRFLPFILMGAAHYSCLWGMFHWTASSSVIYLYVISAVWGIGSGIIGSQAAAICNVAFPNKLEPTINLLQALTSTGGMFFFGISSVFCTGFKMYLLAGIIGCGIAGVGILEILLHFEHKQEKLASGAKENVPNSGHEIVTLL